MNELQLNKALDFDAIVALKKEMSERLGWLNSTLIELQKNGVKINLLQFTDTTQDGASKILFDKLDIVLTVKI